MKAAHTDSVGNFEPPVSVSQTSSSRGTSRGDGNEAPSHIDQVHWDTWIMHTQSESQVLIHTVRVGRAGEQLEVVQSRPGPFSSSDAWQWPRSSWPSGSVRSRRSKRWLPQSKVRSIPSRGGGEVWPSCKHWRRRGEVQRGGVKIGTQAIGSSERPKNDSTMMLKRDVRVRVGKVHERNWFATRPKERRRTQWDVCWRFHRREDHAGGNALGVRGGQRHVPDGTTKNHADGTRTGRIPTRTLVRSWIQGG